MRIMSWIAGRIMDGLYGNNEIVREEIVTYLQ